MKFWQYYILFSLLLSCSNSLEENSKRSVINKSIYALGRYDIASLKSILDTIPKSLTKNIIEAEYKYLKTGKFSDNFFEVIPESFKTKEEEAFYNYSYGDYLFRKSNPIDTLSFKYFLKAYSIAKEEKNNELTIESLVRINNFFKKYNQSLNESNSSIEKYKKYQNELNGLTKGSDDLFWAKYYDLHLRILQVYNKEIPISTLELEDFKNTLNFVPDDPYFKGIIYQLQGIYYTLLKKNPIKGKESNKIANEYYIKSNIFPAERAIFGLTVNDAIADYGMKNYEIAIKKFINNLNKIPDEKSYHFERWFTYAHLDTVYTLLNNKDSLIYYKNLAIKYKNSINEEQLVLGMHEIDQRLKVTRLQKISNEFKRHKLIYGALILIILSLTVYSLFRWFNLDKANKTLNTEKKQSQEELTKVKQLVIKDSITLKNKTKILLDQLIYIKADDHYLLLYTATDKKVFVRGKIKDIIKELPPNFKQCHRSYIVNYNKIRNTTHNKILLDNNQFIPLSRSFKSNF